MLYENFLRSPFEACTLLLKKKEKRKKKKERLHVHVQTKSLIKVFSKK